MSKVTLDNESRRNFLVRSVATAGGAYFSIGLGLHAVHLVHHHARQQGDHAHR